MQDGPHPQAQEAVELAHPLGVAAGEVVVDRDDVHAVAGQGVQVGRQGRDQGLALAGLHLGDLALVQHHAADQLDVEVAHLERADRGFAHGRERLRQQVVQRLAVGDALPETPGLGAQILVGHGLHARLEGVDPVHDRLHPLDFAVVLAAEHLGQKAEHRMGHPLLIDCASIITDLERASIEAVPKVS